MSSPRVLVVAHSETLGSQLHACAARVASQVLVATSYGAGKSQLGGADLLVTELKLGDYNGLQLAMRAQSALMPTIVIGPGDDVLARQAAELGATYLRESDADDSRVTDLLRQMGAR